MLSLLHKTHVLQHRRLKNNAFNAASRVSNDLLSSNGKKKREKHSSYHRITSVTSTPFIISPSLIMQGAFWWHWQIQFVPPCFSWGQTLCSIITRSSTVTVVFLSGIIFFYILWTLRDLKLGSNVSPERYFELKKNFFIKNTTFLFINQTQWL